MSASSDDYHDALKYIRQLKKALIEILDNPKLYCDKEGCTYCGAELLEIVGKLGVVGYQINHTSDCDVTKWRKLIED